MLEHATLATAASGIIGIFVGGGAGYVLRGKFARVMAA